MRINQIFLKPILTEKSTNLIKNNLYMFEVDQRVNKFQLKKALEKLYSVEVADIRVNNRKGKMRKVGRKQVEKRLSAKKIVFIKLKTGKIDLFPQT